MWNLAWKPLVFMNIMLLLAIFVIFFFLTSTSKKQTATNSLFPSTDALGLPFLNQMNWDMNNIFILNEHLNAKLDKLRATSFFKIFKVKLDNKCQEETQNTICSLSQCEVNPVPYPWNQTSNFFYVETQSGNNFFQWKENTTYSTNWLPDAEIEAQNGIYVNLENNPHLFTAYQGQRVWDAIYNSNCYSNPALPTKEPCYEEKILYMIISGLHSNINTFISYNYVDIPKNVSYINYTMLIHRVTSHPDRMNNLFFLYTLLVKALFKAEGEIHNYRYYTGDPSEDSRTKAALDELFLEKDKELDKYLNEGLINHLSMEDNIKILTKLLSNPIKQAVIKNAFLAVPHLIDCVSCTRCRLYGKLQTYGLSAMINILFNKNCGGTQLESFLLCSAKQNKLALKRNELIALINVLGKVSKAIHYIYTIEKNYTPTEAENINVGWELILVYWVFCLLGLGYLNYRYIRNPKNQLQKSEQVKKHSSNTIEIENASSDQEKDLDSSSSEIIDPANKNKNLFQQK